MNLITSNTSRIKQLNTELVKNALIKQDYGTKLTISSATGLSVATCGNILNELLEKGEVLEIDLEQPNGGRPARRFVYNANYCYLACIYLSLIDNVYSITYAVVNMVGERIEEKTIIYDCIDYETIDALVGKLLAEYELIKAVGIGIPGVACQGVIVNHCDVQKIMGVPLVQKLKEKYQIDIIVENDMNLIALGFYKKREYDEDKNFAVVNFPKDNCIGSGIIVNGHVIKGNTNFAGEVSYLPFDMSQDEEIAQLNSRDGLMPIAAKTLISIIVLINPDTIALVGDLIKKEMLGDLTSRCLEVIPKEHMPKLAIIEDVHEDYINGLISVTIESLSYDIQLVKKRI
jgi:hypothetical protein